MDAYLTKKPVAITDPANVENVENAGALLKQFAALVAAAEPAAAEAYVSDLRALVTECAAVAAGKKRAASAKTLGAPKWAVEASCAQPRGRLSLQFGDGGLFAVDPKKNETRYETRYEAIRGCYVFPPVDRSAPGAAATCVLAAAGAPPPLPAGQTSPSAKNVVDAYKKASLVVGLDDKLGKGAFDAAGARAAFPGLEVDGATLGAALPDILAVVAGDGTVTRCVAGESDRAVFASLVTGDPYVRANLGASAGHLALCAAGLFFQKPPLFLPTNAIASIECGRAGAANCSSFDLVIELDSPYAAAPLKPAVVEFSGIAKDELPEIRRFIVEVLLPFRAAADGAGGAADGDALPDSESDDDDFDPDADDSDDGTYGASDAGGEGAEPAGAADADATDSDDNGAAGSESGCSEDSSDSEEDSDASDDGLKPGGLDDDAVEAPLRKKRRRADGEGA